MGRTLQSVSVNLEPGQFLAGWRPETESLFLPTLSQARVGDEVAVRIGIYGQAIRATIFGRVSLVRRVGRPSLPPGAELALDRGSVPAARFLAMAARGEAVTFQEREPRYVHERDVRLESGGRRADGATINVSEGGCSVRWPADLPQVGEVVTLRLTEGLFAPGIRAVVCWSTLGGPLEKSVGLRILTERRGGRAWRHFVASVARAGARTA